MFAQIQGRSFHYTDVGDGPPLLLLHGLGSSVEDWAALTPRLASRHRVLAMDLRGHGQSYKGDADFSLADAAQDVLGLLDTLDVPRADVFGISMGGMVAQHLALIAPGRVGRLLLHNTAASTAPRDFATLRAVIIRRWIVPLLPMHRTARLIGDKLFPKPDQQPLRDYIAAQWVKNDPKDYVRVTKATLNHRLGRGVGAITSPTLVIAAAHDGTIPRAAMEELAAWIPDARLTIVPDCGHGAPLEVPDQIADLILGFTA